jgi:acetyl-CoA carboxylase/biotin carboxylase 1
MSTSSLEDLVESGPAINTEKRAQVEAFVKARGGKRVIQRILIANNGMAATKSILSMRKWAYITFGDEKALEFVAMATRDDLNANAEFIRLADSFVEVPSGSNKNNYANVDLIVDIAVSQKVDAVWPGWGHASENPNLPSNLSKMGIQFIGPTASVMAALGDKVSANILAQTADVPSIPWSGGDVTCGLNEEGVIPKDVFDSACVFTADQAAEVANKIGYPVMIKASEGGGGKGIRMAGNEAELRTNFVQVVNEVPGSPIFMMQLCTEARHLEVQIVGDEYGNAVALNGRDCSTQRRFQKIFEEGPPTIAPRDTFKKMERSAQRLTQSIGYIGAGTVEYLYNAASDKYYFLELNPRLQVEHPVTEGLTETNLPSIQLQVAMGIALDKIPLVRTFFGRDPSGLDSIDFMNEDYIYPNRHVIAARITAENPDEGFKPTSGRIERVKFQSTPDVWGYFSVGANGGIHEFADSQFGHIFASGYNREDARKALVLALKEIEVRGDIRTPVDYLVKLLETSDFKENTIDTSWLDGLIREKSVSTTVDPHQVALSAAIFRATENVKSKLEEFATQLGKGQFSLQGIPSLLCFPVEITYADVKYKFDVDCLGPNMYKLTINNQVVIVRVREQPDNSLLCNVNGENLQLFGQDEALGTRMRIDGETVMIPTVFNPSELRSDVTGKVVRFLHAEGESVEKDEPYVEVEAMKMIMAFKATESGEINHVLSPGSIIGAGDLIASLKLKDPSKVKQISQFQERLSTIPKQQSPSIEEAAEFITQSIAGFPHDYESLIRSYIAAAKKEDVTKKIAELLKMFSDAEAPFVNENTEDVVGKLVKANKDDVSSIIPTLIAHKQYKYRCSVALALMRQIEVMIPSTDEEEKSLIASVLHDLTTLSGEVSLRASQLVDEIMVPPFEERVSSLKSVLMQETADLDALSKQPNLAVSVDTLTVLFSDENEDVRKAAMEVYIRRVYRAHCIKSISIIDNAGLLTASWTFTIRDIESQPGDKTPLRKGYMAMLDNFESIDAALPELFSQGASHLLPGGVEEPVNALHIGYSKFPSLSEVGIITKAQGVLKKYTEKLQELDLRSVNFMIVNPGHKVTYFNFPASKGFNEDATSRNMRPTMPQLLELNRLSSNHELSRMPTVGRNSQLYFGLEKAQESAPPRRGPPPQVLFLRSISLSKSTASLEGTERVLLMAMDELDRAMLDPRVTPTTSSRVFLNFIPDVEMEVDQAVANFQSIMEIMISKYATRLLKLRVDEIEVKLRVQTKDGAIPIRLMASSFSGGWLSRQAYREYLDPITGQTTQYCSLIGDTDVCVLDPYPTSNQVQLKRATARRIGSTYANDFLGLFEVALINQWQTYLDSIESNSAPPPSLFTSEELVLDRKGEIAVDKRFPGSNKIGMIAWLCNFKSPQYPNGREMILIANDVTVQSGSFGVEEDQFFYKASEYARKRGIPRVFISCNSGARIGLVDELKPKYQIQWKDSSNPAAGFDYLYLTEEDFESLQEGTVQATRVESATGEVHYKLDAIIGQKHGIGVENLRGSGLIAGETSRAYDETFTLSYVTGRSVGIGAYLNRLGQRIIQMQQGPMILTGYSALNKLLGKEVYTSQDQLGGPQIMYPNGISHQIVSDDQEGMQAVLDWLSYTPKDFVSIAPVLVGAESSEREIGFIPSKTPYDPRHMLAGLENSDGSYLSGFCDKGSFKEYLGGWGKSVIAGRGRLGGINIGVIAVETRLVEQIIPADPGNPESREAIQPQAGQVWYPDSAFKTAQAIEDFNRGENLPLIIFANWRGFSGGTRDMYGEILKFGAQIVDALRNYKHPVFVYIPPGGELRGGAWVVIDPTINPDKMEMYADKESRGGILEPPGICEVKYRAAEQMATAERLDPILKELEDELTAISSQEETDKIKQEQITRKKMLQPIYLQAAHEFADLHDRAGRMKAKNVISEILDWRTSRSFFYWRILRRQKEDGIKNSIVASSANVLSLSEAGKRLEGIFPGELDNRAAVEWLNANSAAVEALVKSVRMEFAGQALSRVVEGLSPDEVATVLSGLAK